MAMEILLLYTSCEHIPSGGIPPQENFEK